MFDGVAILAQEMLSDKPVEMDKGSRVWHDILRLTAAILRKREFFKNQDKKKQFFYL